MIEPTFEHPEPNILVNESRAFWRDIGRKMIRDSSQTIDNTAKQFITVTGILEGLYFHAIVFSDIQRPVTDAWLLLTYTLPVLLLLISLISALLVFFPKHYSLNFNSSDASQIVYERVIKRKHFLLRSSSVFLVLGIFSIFIAVLTYLQR